MNKYILLLCLSVLFSGCSTFKTVDGFIGNTACIQRMQDLGVQCVQERTGSYSQVLAAVYGDGWQQWLPATPYYKINNLQRQVPIITGQTHKRDEHGFYRSDLDIIMLYTTRSPTTFSHELGHSIWIRNRQQTIFSEYIQHNSILQKSEVIPYALQDVEWVVRLQQLNQYYFYRTGHPLLTRDDVLSALGSVGVHVFEHYSQIPGITQTELTFFGSILDIKNVAQYIRSVDRSNLFELFLEQTVKQALQER